MDDVDAAPPRERLWLTPTTVESHIRTSCESSTCRGAQRTTAASTRCSPTSGPLLRLAEHEKRLRIDAVVLHGTRGGLALHDLLEGLEVGDLGDQPCLLGPVRVPERPNGD